MKKKRWIFIIIFIILVYVGIVAVIGYSEYRQYLPGYDPAFTEELNRHNVVLYRKSNWPRAMPDESVWKKENVDFKDGIMSLTIDKDENGYTGGEYFSREEYGYGLYQVNMKAIKNPGVVSSFFNYSRDETGRTEIDIEFLGYDTTKVQFNYFTNDNVGGHEYLYDLGFDASEAFHNYAFYWGPNEIIWYVDGKQAYTMQGDIPTKKAAIFMDAWTGDQPEWLKPFDGTTPLTAYYDWFSYSEENIFATEE